jgi:hypothetical protein
VLFQKAVVAACEKCGVKVTIVRERDVWQRAANAYGLNEAQIRKQVDELKQGVGAPWGADQKVATAAALLALSNAG